MAATVEYNVFDFSQTDWENLGDVTTWPINYVPEAPQDADRTPIAVRVLQQNNIDIDATSTTLLNYGVLDGYDIHNMDAVQAIKSSLIEEIRDEKLIEIYANPQGYAEFTEIGSESFAVTPRYKIPNRKVINRVRQISTTGFNPPASVYIRGPFDLLSSADNDVEIINDIANFGLKDTCYEELFARYATIMYRTPILKSDWGDILDSLYNVRAYEQIIGWIHKILIDDSNISEVAEVIFNNTTPYPMQIPVGLNEFREDIEYIRYNITPATQQEITCAIPTTIDFNTAGITLTIPNSTYIDESTGQELSDILEVRQVFIVGWQVIGWYTITEGSVGRLAVSCKHRRIPYNLTEGSDYAWGYDDEGNLKIIFGIAQTEYDAYIEENKNIDITSPETIIGGPFFDTPGAEGTNFDDYRLWPHLGGSNSGGAGGGFGDTVLFDELWVVVTRNKSSITIYDPEGNADEALRNSEYELYAIISCDPPAPIAGYGANEENDPYFIPFDGVVDHLDCVFDHDPMTFQDLTTCDSALLQEAMAGAGQSVAVTAPFIDDDIQIEIYNENSTITYVDESSSVLYRMSRFIYDLTNEEIDEYTYVFGPTELTGQDLKLGMRYNDGYINSISYSYQDSSSYLINVIKGPKYLKDNWGLNESSIWQMETETVSREGVVTQVAGNGIHYAVHVEGMGDFIAVNTVTSEIPPEVGDRVTIEIYNVPVGWK